MADTTIDLLKNSSYVGKMDELIAAVKSGGGTASDVEWDNVKNKPTTIGGYGIIDAKIDNGTITLGNQTITPLTSAPVTSVNSKTGAVTLSATDVSAIPSTLTGTAGQVLTKTADGQEWKDVDIPTALPNPNALTFTGAVEGTYDGSAPLSVEIPGGGSGNNDWELLADVTLTEDVATIAITQTPSGEAFSVRELVIIGTPISDGTNKTVQFAPYATEIKYGVELMSLGEVLSSTDGGTSYLSALIQVLPEVVYARIQYSQYDNSNVGYANKLNASRLRNEANVSSAENGDPITKFAIGVWYGGTAGVFRAGTKMRVYGR